ncbi:hypothetical protein RJ641_015382 [Dillenia turbinata]|uniref:Uncharacterized protein n=1 Tax=Dillenia turbinata TaxID=194707 RepID=A0AAN8UM78_9MAGN
MASSTLFPTTPSQKKSAAMTSSTLFTTTPSQLCSSKSGMFSASQALVRQSARTQLGSLWEKRVRITCQATSVPADDRVPDMGKR